MIEELVHHILTTSTNEPIIIIQSDHGPSIKWSRGGENSRLDEGIDDLVIFERTGILNAYYLPSNCNREGLYPSISPVNSFRVVFNSCLGANFDLLDDKSYFFRQRHSPYGFLEVAAVSP